MCGKREESRGSAMNRKNFTQKIKLEALAKYARCPECNGQFGTLSSIDFDHIEADALGGDNTVENCRPLCKACHSLKTNGRKHTSYGSDKHAIAKNKRINGLTKTGPKAKIKNRGFNKGLSKGFDGKVRDKR